LWVGTFGSYECPVCGQEPVGRRRPSLWVRSWAWLRSGTAAATIAICANGHEWADSGRSVAFTRIRGPRWLRRPVELFRAVHRNRALVPVPLTYLMAAVAGAALGTVLDVLLDWPWWLVAAGFVVLTWFFFTTSGLWSRSSVLWDDLVMVIDPLRADTEKLARLSSAVADGRLACFTVDGWTGPRALSGWGGEPELDLVALSHGRIYIDPGWVIVTTASNASRDLEAMRVEAARELLAQNDQPPVDLPIEEFPAWLHQQQERLEHADPPPWSETTLVIEGRPLSANMARIADSWTVLVGEGDLTIEVRGSGVDPNDVALLRVADLEPYIEGLRRLR
jgi:hypothetical protein